MHLLEITAGHLGYVVPGVHIAACRDEQVPGWCRVAGLCRFELGERFLEALGDLVSAGWLCVAPSGQKIGRQPGGGWLAVSRELVEFGQGVVDAA
jgi:hypothetical protein